LEIKFVKKDLGILNICILIEFQGYLGPDLQLAKRQVGMNWFSLVKSLEVFDIQKFAESFKCALTKMLSESEKDDSYS